MNNITYCLNRDCPFNDCPKHYTKLYKLKTELNKYIIVSDYSGTCRKYISYILDYIVETKGE